MGRSKPSNVRRCIHCNRKTFSREWIDQKCPICDSGLGWKESKHGAIRDSEIEAERMLFLKMARPQCETIAFPHKYGRER